MQNQNNKKKLINTFYKKINYRIILGVYVAKTAKSFTYQEKIVSAKLSFRYVLKWYEKNSYSMTLAFGRFWIMFK